VGRLFGRAFTAPDFDIRYRANPKPGRRGTSPTCSKFAEGELLGVSVAAHAPETGEVRHVGRERKVEPTLLKRAAPGHRKRGTVWRSTYRAGALVRDSANDGAFAEPRI